MSMHANSSRLKLTCVGIQTRGHIHRQDIRAILVNGIDPFIHFKCRCSCGTVVIVGSQANAQQGINANIVRAH